MVDVGLVRGWCVFEVHFICGLHVFVRNCVVPDLRLSCNWIEIDGF